LIDDPRIDFVESLAAALAPLGQTSAEMLDVLSRCADALGLNINFMILPTAILGVSTEGDDERTILISVSEGAVDLETLELLQHIAGRVIAGDLGPTEGRQRIDELVAHPPRFPLWLRLLAGSVAAAAITLLLGGGTRELVAAIPCGLGVAIFYQIGVRIGRMQGLLELSSAAFATCLALTLGQFIESFDSTTVIIAAIVQLLPGLRITTGVAELAAGHVVAGTSRLAGAGMTLLNLSIGVAVVSYLFEKFGAMPPQPQVGGPSLLMVCASVPLAALAFTVTQNARRRDVGWVFLGVAVATVGSRFGAWLLGSQLGIGVASFGVGLAGNLYSRYLHHPKSTLTVPGLTILVPGALGFEGVLELVSHTGSLGSYVVVSVVLLAAGLVVGLMIAESIVQPRALSGSIKRGVGGT
jgi:uncharacterized membrane protein YjjP (DUF1212 family)